VHGWGEISFSIRIRIVFGKGNISLRMERKVIGTTYGANGFLLPRFIVVFGIGFWFLSLDVLYQ